MKEVRVVLANKTVLTTGRKGPDFSPFKETPANLIKELTHTKPAPIFKYADNLNRAITLEELQTMLKLTTDAPKVEIKIEVPKDIIPPTAPIELDKDGKEIETEEGDKAPTTFEDLGDIKVEDGESTDMNTLPPATDSGNTQVGQKQKQGRR